MRRTFPPGRFQRFRMCPGKPLAPPCGSRKSASKYLGRICWAPGPRETCNSILPVDLHNVPNGVNFGLARLRIASMRMDWKNTSIVAGQDNAFFSPLSPTSFASLALPAFSYAGNLWGWIPQVRIEHRFNLSEGQSITLQGGVMDNVTGELPSSFEPFAQAGESSGQPAYATRVAWTRNVFGMPLTVGAAGYYGRQNWRFRSQDGWLGRDDGLERSPDATGQPDRRILSRARHWRSGRRGGTKRALQQRFQSGAGR